MNIIKKLLCVFCLFISIIINDRGLQNAFAEEAWRHKAGDVCYKRADEKTNRSLENFVNRFINLGMKDDIRQIMRLYADVITYYDKGYLDQAEIIQDKRTYFERWPKRSYKLDSPIEVKMVSDGMLEVKFYYSFLIENSKRQLKGKAWNKLVLNEHKNRLFITSEQGGIEQKQRFPVASNPQTTIGFLNKKMKYQTLKDKFGIESDMFENKNDKELIIKKIRTNGGIIMKITDGLWNWQYLIFLYFDNKLNYIDNIDFKYQKSRDPEIRFYNTDDSNLIFFAVSYDGGSGTGVSFTFGQWYRLNRTGIELMFEYPKAGYVSGWLNFDREFDSEADFNIMKKMVRIRFKATYTAAHPVESEVLFTIDKTAFYQWNPDKGSFIFDSHRSDISEKAIDGIFSDSYDDMLENNFEELMKLSENGSENQKKWLKLFLKECSDSIKKSRILKKLR